jgi:predicted metal-dependent phosphoesterase TrpH
LLIDMHVHTRRHSACGRGEPEEMVAAARRYGLDALVFTEHHVMWGTDELAELQREFPSVRLFTGVEISTEASGDLLAIGAEGTDWFEPRMPADVAVKEAHARGGIVIAAHPYRPGYGTEGLHELHLDAIEVYSLHMHIGVHRRAVELATARGLKMVGTSDAHAPDAVGLYAIRLDEPVASERALAEAILAGSYSMAADEDRVRALNRDREPAWREVQDLIRDGLDDRAVVAMVDGVGYTETRLLREGQAVGWPIPASIEVLE